MIKALIIVLYSSWALVASAADPKLSEMTFTSPDEVGLPVFALDLDVDFGLQLFHSSRRLQSRVRVGGLWGQGINYRSLGAVIKLGSPWGWVVGVEGEILNIGSGLWLQGQLGYSERHRYLAGISAGWSVLGVEIVRELSSAPQLAVMAKVRLPLGLAISKLSE